MASRDYPCPKCNAMASGVHVYYGEDIWHCSECNWTARMSYCPMDICPNTSVLKD